MITENIQIFFRNQALKMILNQPTSMDKDDIVLLHRLTRLQEDLYMYGTEVGVGLNREPKAEMTHTLLLVSYWSMPLKLKLKKQRIHRVVYLVDSYH